MDKKRSILNVSFSLFSRMLLLLGGLYVRRLLIQNIGNEVNGLNSLFASIIGMLSVAEMGVGSAILFSMYSPIVAGDRERTAALYCLYQRLYRMIGAVILGAGLILLPFLPALIGDYEHLHVNVYTSFLLTLISVVLTYLYGAKTSLIEAYRNNYITTAILTVCRLLRLCIQAFSIVLWQSYTAFLVCQIVETLLQGAMTDAVVRKMHGDVIILKTKVDPAAKKEIQRNIQAMFLHKIGTILVNSTDNIIISAFIGIAVLGRYSNYALLAGVLTGTLELFFSPLTTMVGHLCAAADKDRILTYFRHFYCLNYILGTLGYLGYYAVAGYLVELFFGAGLGISRTLIFIITINQFTRFIRRTMLLFRDASGTFYNDRWKPIAEGIINLLLSLFFVFIFPADHRVDGVIAATIITTLLICHTVEPYVVFRHVFGRSPRKFCLKNYAYMLYFFVCLLMFDRLTGPGSSNPIGNFPATGGLSAIGSSQVVHILMTALLSLFVSTAAISLLALVDKAFREELTYLRIKVFR